MPTEQAYSILQAFGAASSLGEAVTISSVKDELAWKFPGRRCLKSHCKVRTVTRRMEEGRGVERHSRVRMSGLVLYQMYG